MDSLYSTKFTCVDRFYCHKVKFTTCTYMGDLLPVKCIHLPATSSDNLNSVRLNCTIQFTFSVSNKSHKGVTASKDKMCENEIRNRAKADPHLSIRIRFYKANELHNKY